MTLFRRAARNVLIVAASYAGMWLATFVFTIAQARSLAPAQFGALSLALSYAAFLTIVVDFGLGTQLSRMVARGAGQEREALVSAVLLRGVLWLLSMPALWLTTALLGYDDGLRATILIIAMSVPLMSVSATIGSYLQGREQFLLPSIASVSQRVTAAGVGMAILALRPEPEAVAWAFIAAAAVNVAVVLVGLRRHDWSLPRIDRARTIALFRSAVPIGLYLIAGTFYFNVDMVMVERLAPAESVGWYAAAYRLFVAATIVPAIVNGMVLYPVFARLSVGARDELRAVVRKAVMFLGLAGVAGVLILVVAADQIVAVLYPGAAYAQAATALRLLAFGIPFLYLNSVFSYALFALNQERRLVAMALAFAIANPIVNLIAIPLWNESGAAMTTSLTEVGLFIWLVRLMPRDLLAHETVRTMVKLGLAAVAAGLAAALVGERALGATVVVALTVYGAAILALHAISVSELRAVIGLFGVPRATAAAVVVNEETT